MDWFLILLTFNYIVSREYGSKPPQLWQESSDCAFNQASADWALSQGWCALFTHHQVSTRDEDNVDFFIHAHFTSSLLLQTTQLLLHRQVWRVGGEMFNTGFIVQILTDLFTKKIVEYYSINQGNQWKIGSGVSSYLKDLDLEMQLHLIGLK